MLQLITSVIVAWCQLATAVSCHAVDPAEPAQNLEATFDQFVADAQAFAEAMVNEHYLKAVIGQSEKDAIHDRYVKSCEALAKAFDVLSTVTQDRDAIIESFERARSIAAAYRKGNGSQSDAVQAFQHVAAAHPSTTEADEAMFYSASLYVQGLRDGDKPDRKSAAVLLKQLIERDGPPNLWTMLAEEELASYPNSADERLRQRSQFLSRMAERRNPEWLKATYLNGRNAVALPGRERVKMISAAISNIIESTARTSYNAVHDASKARDPGHQLATLKTTHETIPFVDDAIERKRTAEVVPHPPMAKDRHRFVLVELNVLFVVVVIIATWVSRRSQKRSQDTPGTATHQKSS